MQSFTRIPPTSLFYPYGKWALTETPFRLLYRPLWRQPCLGPVPPPTSHLLAIRTFGECSQPARLLPAIAMQHDSAANTATAQESAVSWVVIPVRPCSVHGVMLGWVAHSGVMSLARGHFVLQLLKELG